MTDTTTDIPGVPPPKKKGGFWRVLEKIAGIVIPLLGKINITINRKK